MGDIDLDYIAGELVYGLTEDKTYTKKEIESLVNVYHTPDDFRISESELIQLIQLVKQKRSRVTSARVVAVRGMNYKVRPSV